MSTPSIIPGNQLADHPICTAQRALLINPPAPDFRLEWAHWHHPLGLELIGALLAERGADVKLIDCLDTDKSRMPKQKVDARTVEDYEFVRWSFGMPMSTLRMTLRKLKPWQPDMVMVTTLNSLWWRGAEDAITAVRTVFPGVQVALGGMYPTYALDHAKQYSSADWLVTGPVPEVAATKVQFRPKAPHRKSNGLLFYGEPAQGGKRKSPRLVEVVLDEIITLAKTGVREFVFFDERIHLEDRDAFANLLETLAAAKLDVSFVLPGNVPPALIDARVAQSLRPAGFKQVHLRCELNFTEYAISYADGIDAYADCVSHLVGAGRFHARYGDISAMLVVGLPNENLAGVSERLIQLSHVVGSVMLVPFQYVPHLHPQAIFQQALSRDGNWGMDDFNSKLFPLPRLLGQPLEEYMELVRLAALLNSKYRSKSFDFLGDKLAARLFRQSLRSQGWNPFGAEPVSSGEEMTEIELTPAVRSQQ